MVTTLPLWNCLTGVASITLPLHFPELLQICTYMLNHSFEQVESRITLCGLNNFVNWPKSWMGMSWIGYELNDLGCGDVDVLAPPVGADGWSNATIWATISFESVNQTKMTSSHLKIVSLLWLFLNWWLIRPSPPNALKKSCPSTSSLQAQQCNNVQGFHHCIINFTLNLSRTISLWFNSFCLSFVTFTSLANQVLCFKKQ